MKIRTKAERNHLLRVIDRLSVFVMGANRDEHLHPECKREDQICTRYSNTPAAPHLHIKHDHCNIEHDQSEGSPARHECECRLTIRVIWASDGALAREQHYVFTGIKPTPEPFSESDSNQQRGENLSDNTGLTGSENEHGASI